MNSLKKILPKLVRQQYFKCANKNCGDLSFWSKLILNYNKTNKNKKLIIIYLKKYLNLLTELIISLCNKLDNWLLASSNLSFAKYCKASLYCNSALVAWNKY